jgi:hypothetical protein
MGMYTAFHLTVELKPNTPQEVIETLRCMVNGGALVDGAPVHPLFGDTRWRFMLQCDSYYFPAETHSVLVHGRTARTYFLTVLCNFRNYGNEIALFLDWLKPYICEGRDWIGYHWYEEADEPVSIYLSKIPEVINGGL